MSSTISLEEQEKLRVQERRVVRKVDWILMPILTVTLGLQVSSGLASGPALIASIMTKLYWETQPFLASSRTST
jgi:hypothetical protein